MAETSDNHDHSKGSRWRRWWQKLSTASEWVLETFRGHSGMDDLRDRED